ncbi:MAG TPA: type 2 isopentenyl-diphosphate Delta-isomerase [Firmicutes bacterium]|nr:type 2 isopentenyl-diphosphate Delta-isomerase [Bacillota bacterium]
MSGAGRKDEHIFFSLGRSPGRADFSDISFIHNCLPNIDFDDVNLGTNMLGRTFRSPLFINALTGGTELAKKINAALAAAARKLNLPMAVGSQMTALQDCRREKSFRIVRSINPHGFIMANIGSYADPQMAKRAVEMIRADALQIHLNAPQELAMTEGDRQFSGVLERIKRIAAASSKPVIVKEVGFGIAREEAEMLIRSGIRAVDVGGKGGTNFLAIESKRAGKRLSPGLSGWGINTAISIIETASVSERGIDILASGGLHNALDIAKALSLGASAIGMAAYPLHLLQKKGFNALLYRIAALEKELRAIMLMTGVSSLAELRKVPLVITGKTAEWMIRRGIDPNQYACRHIRG